jgi:DNA repair exonuclease SbcCD ATPase subunit
MKLSLEQANQLLSELMPGVAVAENEHDADNIDVDSMVIAINKAVTESLRPTVEAELKPGLESSFLGRHLGALRSAAQRVFNVPKRELEEMNIEQLLAKCKGALESRYNQTDEQRNAQVETTVHDYETQIEQLKSVHEQQLSEERAKYMQRDITARCISLVEKLPRKGGDLMEQADLLRYKMQSAYEVRYNEERKQLEFYKEGKPAMQENNQPVTDEDFAKLWAEKAGILVNDTRHVSPSELKAGQQGVYTGIITPENEEPANDAMDAIVAWAG